MHIEDDLDGMPKGCDLFGGLPMAIWGAEPLKLVQSIVIFVLAIFLNQSTKALADNDILNAVSALNGALSQAAKTRLLGNWNGSSCALMGGFAPLEYLSVINARGTAPFGFKLGTEIVTLSDIHPEILSRRTFRNCTTQLDTAARHVSQGYSQTISLTMNTTTTTSVTATLSGTATVGIASETITFSGTQTWSASISNTQSKTETANISDDINAPLPPGKEFDIVITVLRGETQLPVYVDAVLDGDINPCFMGPRVASAVLSEAQRTFRLKGVLSFAHADSGQITVTPERAAQCTPQ